MNYRSKNNYRLNHYREALSAKLYRAKHIIAEGIIASGASTIAEGIIASGTSTIAEGIIMRSIYQRSYYQYFNIILSPNSFERIFFISCNC